MVKVWSYCLCLSHTDHAIVSPGQTDHYEEVLYLTRLTAQDNNNNYYTFKNVTHIQLFTPLSEDILQLSHLVLLICEQTEAILAVDVYNILSVITIILYRLPYEQIQPQQDEPDEPLCFFVMERPRLTISNLGVVDEGDGVVDNNKDKDNAHDIA